MLIAGGHSEVLASVSDSLALIAAGNIVALGPPAEVLRDRSVSALGVEELAHHRLRRLAREAGLDPALLEPAS